LPDTSRSWCIGCGRLVSRKPLKKSLFVRASLMNQDGTWRAALSSRVK
jgi:hypothetical protein